MDYYSHNATTNVQIFTTLHGHYNAKPQASYKIYNNKLQQAAWSLETSAENTYQVYNKHYNAPKIDFTSYYRRLYIYQVMINLWKHMTGNKCLEIIIQHWKIQALTIRMIENYMYFAISPTAWIIKISTLFMALPGLVATLNIKLIYISKNSNKNVLKQYSVSKLYSLFHGLHLLLADYFISLFFVCNSYQVAWTWQKSSSVNEFYVITSVIVNTTFVILLSLELLQTKNIRLKLVN